CMQKGNIFITILFHFSQIRCFQVRKHYSYISGTLLEKIGTSLLILGTISISIVAFTVSTLSGLPEAIVLPHGSIIIDSPANVVVVLFPTVLLEMTKHWFSMARAICKCFQCSFLS